MKARAWTSVAVAVAALLPAHAQAQPEQPGAPAAAVAPRTRPLSAAAALDQTAAAYEYGDLAVMVDSARLVTEGALPGTVAERADALRFLGIGLYLTGRLDGAEVAFTQLLALRPDARLDPTTTRPEVVAFFGDLRRRQDQRRRSELAARKRYFWNFLPPAGQFQNGDNVKGAIVLGLEALALGSAVTSYALLRTWCESGTSVCHGHAEAQDVKTFNHVAVGVFAATYVLAVADAVMSYGRQDEPEPEHAKGRRWTQTARLHLLPTGAALSLRF